MSDVWLKLEQELTQLYNLPHNQVWLKEDKKTTLQAVNEKLSEVRSGFISTPVEQVYFGPKVFLRVVGKNNRGEDNRVFSGDWWFDADILTGLENSFSRVHFSLPDRKVAIRDLLREVLAISTGWNSIEQVWSLEIPAGQTIKTFMALGSPQKLFNNIPLTAKGNRTLVGMAYQHFVTVKNPFWIQKYTQLFD